MRHRMPSSNQDEVIANANRSAIRIGDAHLRKSNANAEEYFAKYLAVRGDAADMAVDLKRTQHRRWIRNVSLKAAVIVGAGAAASLALTSYRQQFVIENVLVLMGISVAFALLAVFTTLPSPIRTHGVEITETVFQHLTPHDRDILFRAHLAGPGVYSETSQILASRYTAESQRDQDRAHRADGEAARALFENAIFDPNNDTE